MYKDFLIFIALATMGLTSCKQKETVPSTEIEFAQPEQKEYVRTNDSKRLAYWLPEKDSINHGFVLVAERLWMSGRENDSVDIFDYDYQMEWQKRCEEALVHCFDSIYPNSSKLTQYEKSDSMLNVIFRFFEEDADESNMGMIINFDLENCFLSYKIAAMSKEILKYQESFDKEIRKWNELHQRMCDFCCGVVGLDWFGGSGAAPASLAIRNTICDDRIADLQNIINYYKDGIVPSAWSMASAMYSFDNALKETLGNVTSTEEMKKMSLFYDKEGESTYDEVYHRVMNTQPLLMNTIKEWIELRKDYFVPKNSQKQVFTSDPITSVMLERMAKTIYGSSS